MTQTSMGINTTLFLPWFLRFDPNLLWNCWFPPIIPNSIKENRLPVWFVCPRILQAFHCIFLEQKNRDTVCTDSNHQLYGTCSPSQWPSRMWRFSGTCWALVTVNGWARGSIIPRHIWKDTNCPATYRIRGVGVVIVQWWQMEPMFGGLEDIPIFQTICS